jgi:recombinational DNA repair protein (RecF pathway)
MRTRRQALAHDLGRYRAALTLLELAHLTAREEHEERDLFRWLEQGLDLLLGGRTSPGLVLTSARLALLRANGLEPALRACASCGHAVQERTGRIAFSAGLGGRLCPDCAAAERGRGRVVEGLPLNVARVAESLMGLSPERLEHTRLAPGLEVGVGALVEHFLEYHLETRPRTSRTGRPPSRS